MRSFESRGPTNADSLGLDHMRAFLTFVEEKSQVRAAKRLLVSQATLFRHVKRVEEHFGDDLFDKVTGAKLSPRGRQVQQLLRSVVADLELGRRRLSREPVIAIAYVRMLRPFVERALRASARSKTGPRFDVRLHELPSEEQARQLRDGKLDVALCYARDDLLDELSGAVLSFGIESSYAIVVPERAVVRGTLNVRALARLHYVHPPDRFAKDVAAAGRAWLAANGLAAESRIECELGTEIISYAVSGRGYGFLPALWSAASHEGAAFVPVTGFVRAVRLAAYTREHVEHWVAPLREKLLAEVRMALRGFP
jgi:DNA-binding transcriptional LysR family regulator